MNEDRAEKRRQGGEHGTPPGCGHSHDHRHPHSSGSAHGHSHAPAEFGSAFALATALNVALVVIQIILGLISNSVALLADAGHNLGDVTGLVMAWGAMGLARRPPSARYTYGLRSGSILAALANAILLLVVTGGLAWEAVGRLAAPQPVAGGIVMVAAGAGVLINGGTALLFLAGRKDDLNVRGAFLHLAADAGISLGVLASGLAIMLTGAPWLDPLVSLGVSAAIIWGSWRLLREALDMALHAVPPGVETAAVRAHLERLPGVERVHDLHIWPMSTTETALTCHLVTPRGHPGDAFLAQAARDLRRAFRIDHATLQIELGDGEACALEPDHVV